jgi:hypothetical protein
MFYYSCVPINPLRRNLNRSVAVSSQLVEEEYPPPWVFQVSQIQFLSMNPSGYHCVDLVYFLNAHDMMDNLFYLIFEYVSQCIHDSNDVNTINIINLLEYFCSIYGLLDNIYPCYHHIMHDV